MGLTARIEGLLPDLGNVLRRFPVAVLAAAVLCVYQLYNGLSFDVFYTVPYALAAGFFSAGAGHLIAETRNAGAVGNLIVAAVCAVFAAALFTFTTWFHTAPLFFFGGIILAVMIAPFLRSDVKQGAIWLFNLRLALAILLAVVVGLVFALGLSAVVAGLNYLLNVDFGQLAYERIWTVATLFVGPVYGLSLVPRDCDEEVDLAAHQGSLLERGVSVLVNYVMVPLVLVYAAILHVYAGKIALLQNLPKGQIGVIVSLFAVGGTVTWLIGWPWREKGTVLLRWFMRGWFWLMPVPAVLLALAIWRRVADYGVTPDRYGIALVAVWTVIVFAYLVWRRNLSDMRVIVGSAAVLLLAASFGPWGAYEATAESQFSRFNQLLEQGGAIKEGKFVGKITEGDSRRSEGYSIAMVLTEVGALDRAKIWFGPNEKFAENEMYYPRYGLLSEISAKLGLVYDASFPGRVAWRAHSPTSFDAVGIAQILGPFELVDSAPKVENRENQVSINSNDSHFEVVVAGKKSTIAMQALMERMFAETKQTDPSKKSPVRFDLDDHVSIVVVAAYGTAGDSPHLDSIGFWLFLRK